MSNVWWLGECDAEERLNFYGKTVEMIMGDYYP